MTDIQNGAVEKTTGMADVADVANIEPNPGVTTSQNSV